jgi:DNA recombination protein RmuC
MDDPLLPVEGAETSAAATPLISGEPAYLWTGAGVVLLIIVATLILIGRWRVGRERRNQRSTEFFQPAGEGAEITFDEAHAAPVEAPAAARKRGPFAALFNWRERAAPTPAEPGPIESPAETEYASVRIERSPPPPAAPPAERRVADWAAIEREERAGATLEWTPAGQRGESPFHQALQVQTARRPGEEDERLVAARAEESLAPDFEPRAARPHAPPVRAAGHDEVARVLSEIEEALHAQREAIQAETRGLLDSFGRRFSDRLDSLAQSIERRALARLAEQAPAGPRAEDAAALLAELRPHLEAHRDQLAESLTVLSKRLDALGVRPSEFAALREDMRLLRRALSDKMEPAAPIVQLSDLVRDALPPNAYEMNAVISGAWRADCLIRLPRPPGPIAVDARFPVEMFHALHQSDGGEGEFRRAALRHIVDIAERLIAPGVTADAALMFIPSETMCAELYARFPEVVQDSYRARVWIVSPTTLMATLHTLSALLQNAPRDAGSTAERALAEIALLRERVAALEAGLGPAREEPPAAPAAEPYPDASEALDRGLRRVEEAAHGHFGDLYADEAEARSALEESAPRGARAPFPLR